MKKLLFLISSAIVVIVFACTKENHMSNHHSDKDTCYIHDTICAPVDSQKLLVDRNWNINEHRFVENNILYHYKRDASGNTVEFPNDVIRFNNDHTGTYITNDGYTFTFNWQYSGAGKNKIEFTIQNYLDGYPGSGSSQDVLWENVVIDGDFLRYAEIYTISTGTPIICSVERIELTN